MPMYNSVQIYAVFFMPSKSVQVFTLLRIIAHKGTTHTGIPLHSWSHICTELHEDCNITMVGKFIRYLLDG